jgi:hypothetical protein
MRRVLVFPAAFAVAVSSVSGAAEATSTTCATTVVCAEYINTSSGVAIHGEANTGIGIRGTSVTNTGFYGASGSGSAGAPGVEGESTNGTGNDAAGAFGLGYLAGKAAPAYGAIAYGSAYGLYGEAANGGTSASSFGFGAFGLDPVQSVPPSGATNYGDFNAGVAGQTTVGTALLAEANGTPQATSIFSEAPVGLYSVAKKQSSTSNPNAFAIAAETNSFGIDIINYGNDSAMYVSSPSDYLYGSGGSGSFELSDAGNLRLSGTLTTSKGGPYVRTAASNGTVMREYTARTTAPDVEDVGEAQLANGHAYVPLDPRLAGSIDRRTPYYVFVTAEGDCNGLFVTQKGPAGFVVREMRGGRSSLAFQYRLVAKPADDDGKRLEALAPERASKDGLEADGSRSRRIAMRPPLSPEALMKRRLGDRGYADAMATVRARQGTR